MKRKQGLSRASWLSLSLIGLLWGWGEVSWAKDPFRTGSEAREMSAEVAAAFEEFFCAGNYSDSRGKLMAAQQASPDEPMVYALLAALAYLDGDYEALARLSSETRQVATRLKSTDPLRGNLYEGVGYGLEAANVVIQDGVVLGLPKALPTLNQLFGSIRAAQAVDAEDPELNLINGYMDLLLTYRDKALTQFQKSAPEYMAYRGQALAYRDLEKYPEALAAVDQAIAASCENPELYYLKAQILVTQGQDAAAVPLFDQALAGSQQLPQPLTIQIQLERDRAAQRSAETTGSLPPPTPTPSP
ncbi:MAG: Sll0314/Alr1548 family TPR repeat-containing protein [Cyanobacteriota bacterium]|nr:Sll0314/Alr1548 family TPR repeat-containing protein [Cyanobacteriota bacterium]